MNVASTSVTDYGIYYVIVSGDCGLPQTSNAVTVDILSPDATLQDLKVNGVTVPGFTPSVTEYTYSLSCNTDRATIEGITNHPGASFTGLPNAALVPGDNVYSLTVTAENGFTTKTYKLNIIRECYIPRIVKDLEDAIICVNDSHTFEVGVEGEGLTYEWYYGNSRILGANTNRYTIAHAKSSDYERYYVIVRSSYNGYRASIYSRQARLWVSEQLPETLKFATYPDPAFTGSTYHLKLAGYSDVTEYVWRYTNDDVTFSPETGVVGENETWATFGTLSEGAGTVTATLTHPCGTREATQTIRVTYPTGVEDVTANQVAIYPNPTTGEIRISNTVANQAVRITDVTGSLKGSYRTQEGVTTIDLTGYPKGAYMAQYGGKTYKVIRK
ncbi:MAG: T9SS type A sorting domain-containing protein [Dysgonamonadaceae bacterium]|nr:T9SS type A sorting domain-containing protein [Dysgonamonadaceae bacterium]